MFELNGKEKAQDSEENQEAELIDDERIFGQCRRAVLILRLSLDKDVR